jgi:predicted ester cyclase
MSVENTRKTMAGYMRTLVQRGPYATYFDDDVTFSVVGTGQEVKGCDAVEQFIRYFHEQAFDAEPKEKNMIVGDGQATLEADFVGTHIGEFAGVAATGKQVNIPYALVYDLKNDKITALRFYMPMDVLLQQIGGAPVAAQVGA